MWIRISISWLILPIKNLVHVSTIFNLFFVYIVSDCEYFQNFEGALLHYDVIVTSYEDIWYFLVSMESRDPYLYIGSKHKGIGRLTTTTPSSENHKMSQEDGG